VVLKTKPAANAKSDTKKTEDEDETLMCDLIDDFCLIVDKSTKRVSRSLMSTFLIGPADTVAPERGCFDQLRCQRGPDDAVAWQLADHVSDDDFVRVCSGVVNFEHQGKAR